MKLINAIYDYEYNDETDEMTVDDDVDILLVPDYVADNIADVVQKFENWSSEKDSGRRRVKWNGNEILSTDTEDFIRFLNMNYFNCENKESVMVEAHTKYRPELPSAEF